MVERLNSIRLKVRAGRPFFVAMLLGAALLAGLYSEWKRSEQSTALDRSLNEEGPTIPRWLRASFRCDPPSIREEKQDKAMANLASTFSSKQSNSGLYYSVHYFGWQWPLMDEAKFREPDRCPPAPGLYKEIAPILERADWLGFAQESGDLKLIERLPPSSYIAKRLGEKAFYRFPLTNSPLGYDNRPYLRILLAYQGDYARPWAARALSAIAPDTKLGTSAAFLAVSTAPDRALPRVEDVMRRFSAEAQGRQVAILDLYPAGRGFTIRDGNRLIELAYALSMAGPQAEPYSQPLIQLLDQRFASGTSFGSILLEPKGLCPVARHIGGRAAAAANAKPYCNVSENY